ncbi:MAG: P pilus assembly protein, chaperone PapD [Leptolyngbya sp. DLM2.Bin27]|nr:MAG: P pilus assembly protein, chaperone PapD [Leptolyngbya sp. DLM2.Bin27]
MFSPRWFVIALRPLACAALALGAIGAPAMAQLSVSPLVIEATTTQGQAQGVITLHNSGQTPSRLRVFAEPFTYGRDGLEVLTESEQDLTPYLLFSPRELVIEPGQTRRVRLVARLLPSLGDGEFRAIIFTEPLEDLSESTEGTATVRVIQRIGITVYVRQGELVPDLAVLSATVQPEDGRIALLVTNTGNATARPAIEWSLAQNGTTLASGTQAASTVIAGGDRNLQIDYAAAQDTPLPPGTYTLSGTLTWSLDDRQETLPFSVPVTLPAP